VDKTISYVLGCSIKELVQ